MKKILLDFFKEVSIVFVILLLVVCIGLLFWFSSAFNDFSYLLSMIETSFTLSIAVAICTVYFFYSYLLKNQQFLSLFISCNILTIEMINFWNMFQENKWTSFVYLSTRCFIFVLWIYFVLPFLTYIPMYHKLFLCVVAFSISIILVCCRRLLGAYG